MTEHLSNHFKIRAGPGISAGGGNVVPLQIWDTSNSYECKYAYLGVGLSLAISDLKGVAPAIGWFERFVTTLEATNVAYGYARTWGGWTSFSTRSQVDVANFGGRCAFSEIRFGGRALPREMRGSRAEQVENDYLAPHLEFWADPNGPSRERLIVRLQIPAGWLDEIPALSLTGGFLYPSGRSRRWVQPH
jgi:hypothetical protein